MKKIELALCLGMIAALLAPVGAQAQRRDDWYRDVRPYLGRGGEEVARRARLVEETTRLRSSIREADRRRELSPREADRLFDRLDRVIRFVRDDKNLSDREFKRRQNDLDGIARDLERAARGRYGGR